jgi:hypothetical protein
VPVGFARSDAGEYTFSLFAVVALAGFVRHSLCRPDPNGRRECGGQLAGPL